MKLSRTSSTLYLSGSMSLAGNYPLHAEASPYSQLSCGNLRELPSIASPSAADVPYLGWSFANYRLEASQDVNSPQVQSKDYRVNDGVTSVRGVKRRVTANRKERRRTLSINNAFQELRECIPNVPSDTKLSKIKTLKLATSYIEYLCNVLSQDDPNSASSIGSFKEELYTKLEPRDFKRRAEMVNITPTSTSDRKSKGTRTGWPQQMWALELKPET